MALEPGIYPDMSMAEYHSSGAIGKSTIWTIHSRTPAHTRTPSDEPSADMEFGTAVHAAILEPHKFDAAVIRGPENRRGNAWKEAQAEHPNSLVLPAPAYDKVLRLRDAVMSDPIVHNLPSEFAMMEHSAFWRDQETGLLCKCRPDLYRGDESLIVDLKTTGDATKLTWQRRAVDLGYHCQAAHYGTGWQEAGGGDVGTFLFLVIEREPPFAHALYELGAGEIDLGHRIIRKSLQRYKECAEANDWPGHPRGVEVVTYPEGLYARESFEGVYS